MVFSYVLFFLAGVGFGYAGPGRWVWFPLAFPLLLALATALKDGVDGTLLVRLAVALVVTAGGILLGELLDRREQARPA
jgi:hypothetical protein